MAGLVSAQKYLVLELNTLGGKLEEVDIRRGIFQKFFLLFVLCMIPLTWLLGRVTTGYKCGNKGFKLNHLLFMDDLKLFAKIKKQIDSLISCEGCIRMEENNFGGYVRNLNDPLIKGVQATEKQNITKGIRRNFNTVG